MDESQFRMFYESYSWVIVLLVIALTIGIRYLRTESDGKAWIKSSLRNAAVWAAMIFAVIVVAALTKFALIAIIRFF